jgi:hypothetical protein
MTDSFQTISSDDLGNVAGAGKTKKALKFLGKKAGPIGVAWTAYDGVNGYIKSRDQGHSVGRSLWEGVKSAAW